jgi:integrase
MAASSRDLALFNLAIDSKLRASDLVRLKVEDICSGNIVRDRGTVAQRKTGRPVQFEITEVTRQSVERFLASRSVDGGGYLFPSRLRPHISMRQYARIVHRWIKTIGLDDRGFGTLAASNEGRAALSEDRQPKGRATAARPRQN